MTGRSAFLDIGRIEHECAGKRIGRRVDYCGSTSSTNDSAWCAVERGDADGLVVLAEHQSSGRGRMGRRWEMPNAAGVLASVVLCDHSGAEEPAPIGLIAAVAVCDAVAGSASVSATIKWPNDVLVKGRKVAGILVESRALGGGVRASVIGVGINCLQHRGHFPKDLAESATSLELECDRAVDRTAVVIRLLRELNGWFGEREMWAHEVVREAWRSRSVMLGGRIRLRQGGVIYSGSVMDVDPTSALVIKLDEGGVRAFSAADTSVVCADASDA